MSRKTPFERFMSKVRVKSFSGVPNDDCWIWQGAVSNGYGMFWYQGRTHHAQRAAWALTHGDVVPPKGIEVCHTCDRPLCVRPSHLFLGTHTDNMSDAARKGRMPTKANGRWKGGWWYHKANRKEEAA